MCIKRLSLLSLVLFSSMASAMTLEEELCLRHNSGESCYMVAEELADENYSTYDHTRAYGFYECGCDLNYGPACTKAALRNLDGKGAKIDYELATKLSNKACNLKDGFGCTNLGSIYNSIYKDYKKAATAYKKACDLKHPDGCVNLAALYWSGQGVKQSFS